MDVYNKSGRWSSSTTSTGCRSSSNDQDMTDMRRGPWTVDEDFTLINHIAKHGEGCWNSLARSAGLKRTGKSCRLRWLNYLRPDVRRGNITLEEQLLILELHYRWGNRWSKIAQHLPGRTDNEIKNYWRTRVQKQAKQLKCDVNSRQFKDTIKYLWMPRLMERIQASTVTRNPSLAPVPTTTSSPEGSTITATTAVYPQQHVAAMCYARTDPENSCTTASSSEYSNQFYSAHDVSLRESNPSNDYYPIPSATDQIQGFDFNQGGGNQQGQDRNFPGGQIIGPSGYYQYQHFNHGMESQAMEHQHHHQQHHHQYHHDKDDQIQQQWMEGDGNQSSDNFWNNIGEEDVNYWSLHNPEFLHVK